MDMETWIIVGFFILILLQTAFFILVRRQEKRKDGIAGEIEKLFAHIERNFREEFYLNREESRKTASENRDDLARSLREFRETLERSMESFNNLQREKFADMSLQQQQLVEQTEKRLDEIRRTVDEKLQKTLNERISQSFRLVTEQLESVQKGLGEMQSLAQDVGGLKRVLSNVKTRGNIGEIQLSMLLEQILAPEQY